MQMYEVTIGKGGSGTMKVQIPAQTPDEARRMAEHQYPGYNAQAVKPVRR